jgi:asparagine synthase (glutamine-hydrolysing)
VGIVANQAVTSANAWIFRAGTSDAPQLGSGPELSVASENGVHVGVSGVLFEPAELADQLGLEGPTPDAATLVLRAYQRLGDGWVHALRGHYAVIVDDHPRRRVMAARDAMGLHPLFVAETPTGLLFSWSTEALLAEPGVSRDLNRAVLAEHLVHRWSDPGETYFSAIRRVPPGHLLQRDRSGTRVSRYWDPGGSRGQVEWLREEDVEQFDTVLNRAVTRCLRQGRTGIFLSGGFDSISIAAMAVDEASKANQPLPLALSLGFPDPACNEEWVQRGAAKSLGMPQEFVPFSAALEGRGLLAPAAAMAASWPAPMMNLWNPAYFALATRGYGHGLRVILTGSGGDEWLTVSPYLSSDLMRQCRMVDLVRFIGVIQRSYKVTKPEAIRSAMWTFGVKPIAGMWANRLAPKYWQARRGAKMIASTPAWVAPDPGLRKQIDDRAHRVLARSEPYRGSFYEQEMRTALEHPLNAIEAEEYFEMGRRLGMRIMHPYWDADLVQLLYRTPPKLLMRGGRAKGLVREALARRFPTLGFERQRKVNATDFYWKTMQSEGPAAWSTLGGASTLDSLGIIDSRLHAAAMTELFAGERPRESYRIWNTLQLEAWTRSRV